LASVAARNTNKLDIATRGTNTLMAVLCTTRHACNAWTRVLGEIPNFGSLFSNPAHFQTSGKVRSVD